MSAEQGMQWDDDDTDNQPGPPERDSSAMRELRNANKAQARKIKELEEKLSSFTVEARSRSLRELLEARDLNPKIATLLPSDVEGEEALDKWLSEYGDVFGVAAPKAPPPPSNDLAKLRQIDQITAAANPAMGLNDIAAALAAASSPEELDALLERATAMGIS